MITIAIPPSTDLQAGCAISDVKRVTGSCSSWPCAAAARPARNGAVSPRQCAAARPAAAATSSHGASQDGGPCCCWLLGLLPCR